MGSAAFGGEAFFATSATTTFSLYTIHEALRLAIDIRHLQGASLGSMDIRDDDWAAALSASGINRTGGIISIERAGHSNQKFAMALGISGITSSQDSICMGAKRGALSVGLDGSVA